MIENPLHIFYRQIDMTLPRIKPRKNLEILLVQCTYLCDPVCMHVLRSRPVSLFFASIVWTWRVQTQWLSSCSLTRALTDHVSHRFLSSYVYTCLIHVTAHWGCREFEWKYIYDRHCRSNSCAKTGCKWQLLRASRGEHHDLPNATLKHPAMKRVKCKY